MRSGAEPCRSTTVTVKGKADLAPAFYEELWMPVMDPPASNRIAVSMWDKNYTTKHSVLGYAYFDYRKVRKKMSAEAGGLMGLVGSGDPLPFSAPFWINFYGAPFEFRTGRTAEFVATYPEFGSTYRGRMLVSMHVVTKPKASEEARPHVKRLKYELPPASVPETALYTFRMHLIYGSEIPIFQVPATYPAGLQEGCDGLRMLTWESCRGRSSRSSHGMCLTCRWCLPRGPRG